MLTPVQALTISLALHVGGIAAAMVCCTRIDRPIGWQGQEASMRCVVTVSQRPSIFTTPAAQPMPACDAPPADAPRAAPPREPAPEPDTETQPPVPLPDTLAAHGPEAPPEVHEERVEPPPQPEPTPAAASLVTPAPEAEPAPAPEPTPAMDAPQPPVPEVAAKIASVDRASVQPSPLDGHQAKPFYPVREMHKGHEGTVVLSLRIGADGCVVDASVARSSGWPRLDDAALVALRQWKFAPARDASGAHETTIEWTVVFHITGVKVSPPASPPAGIG